MTDYIKNLLTCNHFRSVAYLAATLLVLSNCAPPRAEDTFEVRIALQNYPESLNPALLSSQESYQVAGLIYETLVEVDDHGQLIPILAKAVPTRRIEDSTSIFTYQIHPEAKWSDNSPVTAHDVAFSLKVYASPLFDNSRIRYSVRSIDSVAILSNSKLEIYQNELSMDAARLSGNYWIMPEHVMDSSQLLRSYNLTHMRAASIVSGEESPIAQVLDQYAAAFNNQNFLSTGQPLGSGPYQLQSAADNQSVILRKRDGYWAHDMQEDQYLANPDKIAFYILPEIKSALTALNSGEIDVVNTVPVADFNGYGVPPLSDQFHRLDPLGYRFVFLGLNVRRPLLSDERFRQGIAAMVDKESIIQITQQGYASPTIGPINPADTLYYNYDLPVSAFDPTKAKDIFEDYESLPSLTLKYNASNDEYEKIALWLQDQASKYGLSLNLEALNIAALRDDLVNHNFDLFLYSFVGSKFSTDFRPIFGTKAAAIGGLNYSGYGDAESDQILTEIANAKDIESRAKAMKAFQHHIWKEKTLQFLYFERNRILVSKKFQNIETVSQHPYYAIRKFQKSGL